jgi:lipopolysaccharide/colanic/teichoic acid biosynthesis glycosyltransferase
MSISTLPNYFTKEKRLLLVGNSLETDSIQLAFPGKLLPISILTLRDLIRNYNYQSLPPDAILFNLQMVSINRLKPILKKLKNHDKLKNVPIIGLNCDMSPQRKLRLARIGFTDCFDSAINWEKIEQRIKFLNKYQQKIVEEPKEEIEETYQIPFNKRLFDVIVASLLLLVLSPFLLIIALLIKLESKGPIFYTSKRVGTGYQIFNFIKFRSMFVGADARRVKLAGFNNYVEHTGNESANATFFKMKDDPRVTLIGKFIRKTSIDELPQLINVLRGEMSIIGNRPLPLYEANQLTCDDWAKRFLAPAGITGLWQVDERGKDNLSANERIQLDINYADNYSFLLDLKILMKTLPAMFQRD